MRFWIIFFFVLSIPSLVYSTPLSGIVVFGDSLSDSGNSYRLSGKKIPADPYYQGRFSNGPIWIDKLSLELGQGGKPLALSNFAFAGAGISTLQSSSFLLSQEIDAYFMANPSLASDKLWVIWIGANDYLMNPEASDAEVQGIIETFAKQITRLIEKGAKNLMILSLADLGATPYAQALEWQSELSHLSQLHNQLLKLKLQILEKKHPKLNLIYVDVSQLFEKIKQDPGQFGIKNSIQDCLHHAKSSDVRGAKRCQGYLFFDEIHPTSRVHDLIAAHSLAVLPAF